MLGGDVAVGHAHVVAAGTAHAGGVPGIDDLEFAAGNHEGVHGSLAGVLVGHLGGHDEVPGGVVAAAGEGALVVETPALAVAAGLAAGVGAVGWSESGADEDVPVVAHLVGERGLHAADDESVDLGVDVHAPADGPVDGGGSLDVLDLGAGVNLLAAELLGEDEAVKARIGHLLRGPLGEVTQLLRLVAGLFEHLLHAGDAFEHGRLLDGVLALDNLGTDHG